MSQDRICCGTKNGLSIYPTFSCEIKVDFILFGKMATLFVSFLSPIYVHCLQAKVKHLTHELLVSLNFEMTNI